MSSPQVGVFYVIQLAPDVAPQRLKMGWTTHLPRRLTAHRCAAPTAAVLASWSSLKDWERKIIEHAAEAGCRRLSGETVDCEDIAGLLERVGAFAEQNAVTEPTAPHLARVAASNRLAQLRQGAVLSQHELAERAAVSRTTIAQIEAGRIKPHPSTVRRLAQALGVEPRVLVDALRRADPA